ncbi:hypothetical protein [Propionicimonas sp.]|uniref:hypothetical protein n=1 Tax=Propionicimonas sp. TaxID=1955623 RepID=UPI0039E34CC3
MRVLRLAPLLLRGRISAGYGLIEAMSVAAFTLSGWFLLVVTAGMNAFYHRQLVPPAAFLAALGDDAAYGASQLVVWTILAACAGVLLIVPVLTLGAAAARMGALGRDRRLAGLRLLGATGGQVVALSAIETMLAALAGAVLGTLGYLATLPLWAGVAFQATPLGAGEMLLPAAAIAGIVGLLVLLAGISSVVGLLRLRISPLGVARRQPRTALRLWRFLALPVVVVAWLVVAPMLNLARELVFSAAVIVGTLGVFMGVINLVGPWLLQVLGVLLARSGHPSVLLAGRRLLVDPKAAWRSVAGLAFVGFTGGALVSLPDFAADADPLVRILGEDVRTGTYLTLAIAFGVAAASTLLNQASAVLDRRGELRRLANMGVPTRLHDRTRLVEVVAPAALSALGSGGLAVFFFGLLPKVGAQQLGAVPFAVALLLGLLVVWAAGEACRPLVRAAVAGTTLRPD